MSVVDKKEVLKTPVVKPRFPIMGKNISNRIVSVKSGLVAPGDSIALTQNEYQIYHAAFEFESENDV